MGQSLSNLPNLALGLGEGQWKRESNLIRNPFRGAGGEDPAEVPEGERPPKCVFQDLVRFPERRPENQRIGVGIQTCPGQSPPTHGDPYRSALMEIQIPTDISEPDAKEYWSGKGPIPGPKEDPHGKVEAVGGQ